MSEGSIKDVLALAEAINARRQSDDKFAELLGEVSTALADITALMERKAEAKVEAPPAFDTEALAKAIAVTLVAGLRNMPAPVVKFEAPAGRAPTDWSRIEIDLHRDAAGRIGDKLTLTRK
jgi:hypothetical protein